MSAKLGMKRETYWAIPSSERTSDTLVGGGASLTAVIFFGSAWTPFLPKTWPKNVTVG